ncbi:potassium transporter [Tsukamurella pulmonis]|uniref:potassium channel family protein n=1 Tax=Tsukamurella pulmonis TaxID=47312 RepID=UPI001EDD1B56|nr:TrkA family potassium uptake protein [Tsukamurella pulmonis]BDD84846.1 potassium transporter [Tsukamurella pulmonis]
MARKQTYDGDRVAVLGLGRFGASLAAELVEQGTEVLGVDSNRALVQQYAEQLTHAAVADTSDLEALRQLGLSAFEHVVVAIGDSLEASILTTSLLVDLGVRDIWAKANTEQQSRILQRIGAHNVVLPEQEMGVRVAHLVGGRRLLDYVAFEEGYVMGKTRAPREVIGVRLGESGIRARYGVTVVAIKHGDGDFLHAGLDSVIDEGDLLIVAGREESVEDFAGLS